MVGEVWANRGGPMTGLLGLSPFPRLRRRESPFDFSLILGSFSIVVRGGEVRLCGAEVVDVPAVAKVGVRGVSECAARA